MPKRSPTIAVEPSQLVEVASLKPHPRNYRDHPDDQIEHLAESIRQHGFYRNIVIARDDVILAGHGIVEASRRVGLTKVSAVRVDVDSDDPAALKILTADNYLPHFAMDDDRQLTNLLKEIAEQDSLFGTGFTDQSLAALLMVTRPASEIADFDAAAEWLGMPEYESNPARISLVLNFDNEADRQTLCDQLELVIHNKVRRTWSAPYPPRQRDDTKSLLFEG